MRRWIRQVLAAALPLLVLVSASCGGGDDGGNGNGGTPDVQVAISPAAVSLPLNSSLSFTAAVVGAPTTPIVADTGAARVANVVTITTTTAHGLTAGQRVTVLGVTNVGFIGTLHRGDGAFLHDLHFCPDRRGRHQRRWNHRQRYRELVCE